MGATLPNNQPGLTGKNVWRQFMVDHQDADVLAPATGSRWMHNNLLIKAASTIEYWRLMLRVSAAATIQQVVALLNRSDSL
jgi:hypothetical protein